jgi:ribokinase
MGRVFVAGSINMDVVATAERHPRIGETVAGREVLYFPGGKGANQAILNPAPAIAFDRALLDLVDILILNETELGLLVRVELRDTDDPSSFIEAARSLQADKNKIVCVTLGKRGVIALVDDEPLIISGHVVEAVDTTGAGDCFVGAVAAQIATGHAIREAFDYANIAASICVQCMGAAPSMPTAAEVAAVRRR